MENFFLEITDNGIIIDIKWSVPTHLITSLNLNIYDIFSPHEKGRLDKSLKDFTPGSDGFLSINNLKLKNEKKSFNICILKDGNKFYVFGSESTAFAESGFADDFKEIIHNFMLSMREYINQNPFGSNTSTRFQFENIQSLNNQLLNTKRMLEKANYKLNILNDDLNNRLVKDSLTGLLIRYQYRAEIERLIASAPDENGMFVFIDIDDFKSVNDNYGHNIGDHYLIEIARRLDSLPLDNKLAMRIAGDEFGLYVHGISGRFEEFAEKIWGLILLFIVIDPFLIENLSLNFSVSAGMAVFGKDTKHIYDLIEYADFAMYQAKRKGKNSYTVFDKGLYMQSKEAGQR